MADYAQAAEFAAELVLEFYVADKVNDVASDFITLARNYYNLYQAQRNFYFTNFQAGGEAPFTAEQFGIPFYAPDYIGVFNSGYFPPGAWYLFNPQLTNRTLAMGNSSTQGYWPRFAQRYEPWTQSFTPPTTILDDSSYTMDLASIYDDWNSYMNRYEEHKRDVFNERRWASQMGALSYGVKEAYTVERGLATSFSVFDKAQGELVSEYSTIGNGLATFAGYRQMQSALKKDLDYV